MRIDQVRSTLRERIARGASEGDDDTPAGRRRRFRERAGRVDDVRTLMGRVRGRTPAAARTSRALPARAPR